MAPNPNKPKPNPEDKPAGSELPTPGDPMAGTSTPDPVIVDDDTNTGRDENRQGDTAGEDGDPSNVRQEAEVERNVKESEEGQTHTKPSPVVVQNGVDYFAASDTGPNRQGNAYGLSRDSLENFKRDAEDGLASAEKEVQRYKDQIAEFERQLSEAGFDPESNVNLNIAQQAAAEQEGEDRGGPRNSKDEDSV